MVNETDLKTQNPCFFYLSPLFPLSTFVERGIGGEVFQMSL
jgi:hypothetical protein